jgi:hypothetical protein
MVRSGAGLARRHTEQPGAITCTVADGAPAGKGFRIHVAGVAAISP